MSDWSSDVCSSDLSESRCLQQAGGRFTRNSMSRIPRSDTKLAANERYGVDPLANLLLDRTVRLAVTGLSGAGKTGFVTSVIHNLLSAAHAPAILPLLGVKGRGRLVAARIASGTALSRKLFPYAEAIAAMAGTPPVWPEGTRDISQIRIAIRYRPEGLAVRQFGPATLNLDIIDYPGEWLIDLPMLGQSFAEWSAGDRKSTRLNSSH